MANDRNQKSAGFSDFTQMEKEALLAEYQEMREEIRTNIELLHTRFSRGVAAIGFVIGYALLAPGGTIFITLVPLLIGILYLLSMQSLLDMSVISRHVYDIEELLSIEEFGWEHRYGGLLKDNMRRIPWSQWDRIDLFTIPYNVVAVLAAFIYFGFIGLAIMVVDKQVSQPVFGFDPAFLIFGFYVILTVLLVVASVAFLVVLSELQPNSR